jgi:hypothetical protein
MGIYYMVINESKKEYLSFRKSNLSIKHWVCPKHGMLLAWIMQYSDWQEDNIRMINDASDEEYCYDISENWKNREEDFVKGFNEFVNEDERIS